DGVDRDDRAAGAGDRRRHLAEQARRAVRQLEAQRQRELCGGGGHREVRRPIIRRRPRPRRGDRVAHVADAPPRELFLIDGSSLVFRAFFALPESIATSKGQPTNAIFGFASMLVKIVSEYGVKPTLVVWDAGRSGREETYSEYKAGRRERPALLTEQWPYMHPLVDAFGYENVKVAGYEADDVIATLAGK